MQEATYNETQVALSAVFREEAGRLVGALIRILGNFEVAEEIVQDALLIALERWPVEGIPAQPGAWLVTVARRRAIDQLRRDARYRDKLAALEYPVVQEPDDRLRLMFNEGYLTSGGSAPARRDLAEDASWLAAFVTRLYPREPEALGLLALMRLHMARVKARFNVRGELILLPHQDRSFWDRHMITEAVAMIEQAAALTEVEALAHDLDGYHLFHAIRGELLLELGRREQAQAAEMRALTLTGNRAEQSLLQQRLSAERTERGSRNCS